MNENFDIELDLVEAIDKDDAEEASAPENRKERPYVSDEKTSPLYATAVKSVVFGSLSVILPLFALIFCAVQMGIVAPVVAATGLVFAIVALKMSDKCKNALEGSLVEGLAKAGRTVSIIGLVIAVVALTYIAITIVISIVAMAVFVVFYVFVYLMAIVSAIVSGSFSITM